MSKKVSFLAILASILGVFVWFSVFEQSDQEKIEKEIAKANYCQTTTDCMVVTGQCPFGCYLPVNKMEASRIENLVNNYESNCVYSCVRLEGVRCVNDRCEIQY